MRPVVHVIGRFPPPVDGQTVATDRLASLLAPACEVRRFTTVPREQALLPAGARERLHTTLHYLRLRRHLLQTLTSAPNAPVLWCSASPDALGHFRDILTVMPCLRPHQDVYAVIHRGHFDRVFRRHSTSITARWLTRRLLGFVFLSESLASQVAAWVPRHKRLVIPNTIDAAVVCSQQEVARKQAARSGRKDLRLLYLSNMIPSKGYLDVLEAVALVRRQGGTLQATFAGRWNSEADHRAFMGRVAALGLADCVTHLGPVTDRAQIRTLHLEADVLALPSYYSEEAQPLALLEALSAATPVIVTRQGAIPEMVRPGREAVFVSPRAPQEIAAALTSFSPDRWMHASRCARERYQSQFSEEVVAQKWLALLRKER